MRDASRAAVSDDRTERLRADLRGDRRVGRPHYSFTSTRVVNTRGGGFFSLQKRSFDATRNRVTTSTLWGGASRKCVRTIVRVTTTDCRFVKRVSIANAQCPSDRDNRNRNTVYPDVGQNPVYLLADDERRNANPSVTDYGTLYTRVSGPTPP